MENNIFCDILEGNNILIAGQTGSGKSNLLNSLILQFIKRNNKNKFELYLIDPKHVEFFEYKELKLDFCWIEHSLKGSFRLLQKVHSELENRFKNIPEKMYPIFIIVDEYSDLICDEEKKEDVEKFISHISKYGGKVNIHIAISTSRPSQEIITDNIKKSFQTLMVGKTQNDRDSKMLLGNRSAYMLETVGQFIMVSQNTQKKVTIPYISEKESFEILKKVFIAHSRKF